MHGINILYLWDRLAKTATELLLLGVYEGKATTAVHQGYCVFSMPPPRIFCRSIFFHLSPPPFSLRFECDVIYATAPKPGFIFARAYNQRLDNNFIFVLRFVNISTDSYWNRTNGFKYVSSFSMYWNILKFSFPDKSIVLSTVVFIKNLLLFFVKCLLLVSQSLYPACRFTSI